MKFLSWLSEALHPGWFDKVLDILMEVVRKETSTVPGIVNGLGSIIAIVLALGTGALNAFDTIITTARGEEPQVLSLAFSLAIVITVMVGFVCCVKIISETEK